MDYKEKYVIERSEYIESRVADMEQDVYLGDMPARNKEVARIQFGKAFDYWEREAVREDSHSPVKV